MPALKRLNTQTNLQTMKSKSIRFTVPPTNDQGSYSADCSASYMDTYQQNALSTYNSARAHDGQPPLARMPRGTVYHKPAASYYVQRRGDGQLETVDQFDTRKEAQEARKEYVMADPTAVHYISRRPCKGWND